MNFSRFIRCFNIGIQKIMRKENTVEKFKSIMSETRLMRFPNAGVEYTIPNGLDEKDTNLIVDNIIAFLQNEKISTRQAQHILSICYERLLDLSFN